MPLKIKNKEILKLLRANKAKLDKLSKETERYNKKCEALQKESQRFVDLMNEEYGWGKWHHVDAEKETFVPHEEFYKDKYIIANPAVREKVELPDDVEMKIGDKVKADDAEFIITGEAKTKSKKKVKSNIKH